MSIPAARIIAGLATTAVAGWFMAGRAGRSEMWNTNSDKWDMDTQYDLMQYQHGQWSGTGLDGAAVGWKRFLQYGPFGLFKTAREWWNSATGFFKDVIMTPFSALALGGLYMATPKGMKPHNWLMKAGKVVKDSGIFQALWSGIRRVTGSIFSSGAISSFLTGALKRMATVPGLLIGATAVFGILQFMKVVNGDEQERLFKPDIYNP